jgi:MSHA biogenesis protein MshP
MNHKASTSRGFALVAALFMIVVLAALGLFALRMSSTQQQSINLTIQGSRAQAAAYAGIEFGSNQTLKFGVCPNTTLNLNQGALAGFTVRVTCIPSNHTVSTISYTVYELGATATIGTYGSPDYSSRRATRTVSLIP